MSEIYKIEFRKKSQSKRRKIFRQRARKVLTPLVEAVAKKLGRADLSQDDVVNDIIGDIIQSAAAEVDLNDSGLLYRNEEEFFETLKEKVFHGTADQVMA